MAYLREPLERSALSFAFRKPGGDKNIRLNAFRQPDDTAHILSVSHPDTRYTYLDMLIS